MSWSNNVILAKSEWAPIRATSFFSRASIGTLVNLLVSPEDGPEWVDKKNLG